MHEVNEICSTERYYRFADKVVRKGRGFVHFYSLDGAEIATATMCDVHNCPTCKCPKSELDNTSESYEMRSFSDVKRAVYAARAEHLDAAGAVKIGHKTRVSTLLYGSSICHVLYHAIYHGIYIPYYIP